MAQMEPDSVDCVLTSPPYFGVRNYHHPMQIGQEPTLTEYVGRIADVFEQVYRVLKPSGVCWLNLGDSYSERGNSGGNNGLTNIQASAIREKGYRKCPGFKRKELLGVPWRVAFAIEGQGWYRRSAIVWAKPNGMPGSQDDRPTSSYETIFLLTKSPRYWSDFDAIKTPPRESSLIRTAQDVQSQAGSHRAVGKTNGPMKAVGVRGDKQRGHSRVHAGFNKRWDSMSKDEQQSVPAMIRDVWFVSPAKSSDDHYAVMPEEIARRCILAGCPKGGMVLDPFAGSGTTVVVALGCGRSAIGIEINPAYVALAQKRLGLFDAGAG